MKKYLCVLMTALMLVIGSVTAYAKTTRGEVAWLSLSFEGTTATYGVLIAGNYLDDEITATLRLWHGSTIIESTTVTDVCTLGYEDTAEVVMGEDYTLTVDFSINGEKFPTLSMTRTCE